jgi:hypothetical protein
MAKKIPKKIQDKIKKFEIDPDRYSQKEWEKRPKDFYKTCVEFGWYYSKSKTSELMNFSSNMKFMSLLIKVCQELGEIPPKFLEGKTTRKEGVSTFKVNRSGLRRTNVPQFVFDKLKIEDSKKHILYFDGTKRDKVTITRKLKSELIKEQLEDLDSDRM